MVSALKRLLDPIYRLSAPVLLLRAELASSLLPQPTGAPTVHLDGSDPDRVLLAGGGTAVGYGVLSHELALAGHLARQVSAATGRGIDVDVLAEQDLTIRGATALLEEKNLAVYDAVVLTLGVTDSLRRTPVRQWRFALTELIDHIADRTAAGVHLLVVAAQPVQTVTTFDNHVGVFAEMHGRALNRESARICAESSQATFVPFNPEPEPSERYRTSQTYGKWAQQVSPTIISVLQKNHPFSEFSI